MPVAPARYEMGTVVVVGSAGVIGSAVAKDLSQRGVHVVGWDRNTTTSGCQFQVDLSQREDVGRAMTALVEDHPAPYCFIMVQGIHELSSLLDEYNEDIGLSLVHANLFSVVNVVVTAVGMSVPPSRFILLGSIAATTPIPFSMLYSASKAGADAFLQAAGYELETHGHSWCVVEIGGVNTGFNELGRGVGSGPQRVREAFHLVADRIHSRHGLAPEQVAHHLGKLTFAHRVKHRYVVGVKARVSVGVTALLGIRGQRALVRFALLRPRKSRRHGH